ncbi:permease [uncultured Deefgea sp.]|uniref:permease n=1 Tax=uncultured Deefgea sp. TaxID=1304914 RepID=UPI00259982A7|nr:permease [uncultured Deefgea sp.]
MYELIVPTLKMFIVLTLELSALYLVISYLVHLTLQRVSTAQIQARFGSKKTSAYFFAALLGALTPFCSCSTIPMLRGLLQSKAGFGPSLTFLFTSPLLNPIILGLLFFTLGWESTSIYAVSALSIAILASYTLDRLNFSRFIIQKTQTKTCCANTAAPASSCAPQTGNCRLNPQQKPPLQHRQAWQVSIKDFQHVLPYLLLGVSIGALMYGFTPTAWIVQYTQVHQAWAIPIAAVIGIPLYLRAEAIIPLSAILVAQGMGTGTALALIIGSAGASLTELILLKSIFKTPMIIAFVSVILTLAIAAGYTQALLSA